MALAHKAGRDRRPVLPTVPAVAGRMLPAVMACLFLFLFGPGQLSLGLSCRIFRGRLGCGTKG